MSNDSQIFLRFSKSNAFQNWWEKRRLLGEGGRYCFFSRVRFEFFHFSIMEGISDLESDLNLRTCHLSINLPVVWAFSSILEGFQS